MFYFTKVAMHYGLEFDNCEWESPEAPGTRNDTFYVTVLRDPVKRSISHFKYEGRWKCNQLFFNKTFRKGWAATEETAKKIDDWVHTSGFVPGRCDQPFRFDLCAVKCYVQAFANASCSVGDGNWTREYERARDSLMRFNFVAVMERMADPAYVFAVEEFFGVPGFGMKASMHCEKESRIANSRNPLVIRNETMDRLVRLNALDTRLYEEASSCLGRSYTGSDNEDITRGGEKGKIEHSVNRLDPSMILTDTSIQVPYDEFRTWKYNEVLEWRKNLTRARRRRQKEEAAKLVEIHVMT